LCSSYIHLDAHSEAAHASYEAVMAGNHGEVEDPEDMPDGMLYMLTDFLV
jgi:hypothetical protein